MVILEGLELYFCIACVVTTVLLILAFVLIGILFCKFRRLPNGESNQLSRQTNMMSDFCYTNPMIVPGEELSRRGFSMYNGHFINDIDVRPNHYIPHNESIETLSKF